MLDDTEAELGKTRGWSQLLFVLFATTSCLAGILGLAVNPFPEDYWFWTKDLLFSRTLVEGAAYTPVAVPAYVYASADLIARSLGVGLEQEFRIAAALLSVLQLVSCGVIFLSCVEIGRPRIGLAVSLGALLFAQSLYMTQAFWSEGVANPLVSGTMYAAVRLYARPPMTVQAIVVSAVCGGLGAGLLTITRFIPGLLLFALLFIAWCRLARPRMLLYSALTIGMCTAIVLGQMAANEYRFGKYVLSDSGGLHLWNTISPIADKVLTDSKEYLALKRIVPDIQGMTWSEVCRAVRAHSPTERCPHDLIKQAAITAVISHPGRFALQGFANFRRLIGQPPDRFGLSIRPELGPYRNPLSRSTLLPPMMPRIRVFGKVLDAIYLAIAKSYKIIVLIAVAVSLYSTLVLAARRLRMHRAHGRRKTPRWALNDDAPLVAALLGIFLASTFATACAEAPLPRYNAIYLPLVAFLFCYASGLICDLATATSTYVCRWKGLRAVNNQRGTTVR